MEITDIKKNGMISLSLEKPAQRPSKKEDAPVSHTRESEETKELLKKISKGDREALQNITDSINQFMETMHFRLQFVPGQKAGMVIIRVLDKDGNVIRQIPPDVMAALSSRFGESIGLLLNEQL